MNTISGSPSWEQPASSPSATTLSRRKESPFSPSYRFAAIDIGSTSVRLSVAEIDRKGNRRVLDELVHPVSLGLDTFRVGFVTPPTLRALCQVLKNFRRVLAEYGVTEWRCVATSAIREATNREVLVDRIAHETGFKLDVIDAVEECRLTYQILEPFLRRHVKGGRSYSLVLDLGGGSTEMMVLRGSNLVLAGTRRLGVIRLYQHVAQTDPANERALLESVIHNVVKSALELFRAYPIRSCLVINALLAHALAKEPETTRLEEDGIEVTAATVSAAAREAALLTAKQLADRFHVGVAEAELLPPTLLVLESFLQGVEAKQIFILPIELLTGIFYDFHLRRQGRDPELAFGKQILRSARGIAEKFHYDDAHAAQVARLSLELYDALHGFLDLGGKSRLYLELAAYLHDIGMFLGESAHHKHSAYIVQSAEIVGLTARERTLIAQITRYHRKAPPRPQHIEFMSLQPDERLRVVKLASLLRIADALDRDHLQGVQGIRVEIGEEELRIGVKTAGDLVVARAALAEKADLFQEITGLRVKLHRITA